MVWLQADFFRLTLRARGRAARSCIAFPSLPRSSACSAGYSPLTITDQILNFVSWNQMWSNLLEKIKSCVLCFKFQHVVIRVWHSSHQTMMVWHDLLSLVCLSLDSLVQSSWHVRYQHVYQWWYREDEMLLGVKIVSVVSQVFLRLDISQQHYVTVLGAVLW